MNGTKLYRGEAFLRANLRGLYKKLLLLAVAFLLSSSVFAGAACEFLNASVKESYSSCRATFAVIFSGGSEQDKTLAVAWLADQRKPAQQLM